MDVKNLSAHLNYFSSKGIIFSLETKALLLNSLTCAKKAYKFVSMQFWGKVETLKESYYIVIGTKADEEADETEKILARKIQGRFTGDPSHKYLIKSTLVGSDLSLEPNQAGDNNEYEEYVGSHHGVYVKEEIRLSVVVEDITNQAFIIPKGAYRDYNHRYIRNFKGLSLSDSLKIENWQPVVEQEGNEINKMEWCVQQDCNHKSVVYSNLYWLGAHAMTIPEYNIYSKVYVGNGERNLDLPFML